MEPGSQYIHDLLEDMTQAFDMVMAVLDPIQDVPAEIRDIKERLLHIETSLDAILMLSRELGVARNQSPHNQTT